LTLTNYASTVHAMDAEMTIRQKMNVINIAVRPDLKARFKEAAQADGIESIGTWMRSVAVERARYLLDPAPAGYGAKTVREVKARLKSKG
jgi:hypothetical protein